MPNSPDDEAWLAALKGDAGDSPGIAAQEALLVRAALLRQQSLIEIQEYAITRSLEEKIISRLGQEQEFKTSKLQIGHPHETKRQHRPSANDAFFKKLAVAASILLGTSLLIVGHQQEEGGSEYRGASDINERPGKEDKALQKLLKDYPGAIVLDAIDPETRAKQIITRNQSLGATTTNNRTREGFEIIQLPPSLRSTQLLEELNIPQPAHSGEIVIIIKKTSRKE